MNQPSRTHHRFAARPDALRVHFDIGLRAYEEGGLAGVQRHRTAVGMLPDGGPASLPYLALRWRELWLLDRRPEALAVARTAMERFPDDPDAVLEVADILGELGAFEEAAQLLIDAASRNPDDAEIWYEAGIALEQIERWDLRLECFRHVWSLEQDREPEFRLWLPEQRFIEVAEATIERLPPHVLEHLGNVAIMVEDYPGAWIFETEVSDPRLLGLFDGPESAYERGLDYVADGPARIYLFRWNIERRCGSEGEVEQQIEITVLHEIGHYLGLDEEELHLRGLG